MSHDPVATIFSLLDTWRHLPAYQLERRADILFAAYLVPALEDLVGEPLHDLVIPEFPIKIDPAPSARPTNHSNKVDYVVFARDLARVYFVELKTDAASRRTEQDLYLVRAREVGFRRILDGLRDILLATNAHQKYHHLTVLLADLGFLELPADLDTFLYPTVRPGLRERLRAIQISDRNPPIDVIYLQPDAIEGERCLDFTRFAAHVCKHADPLSQAFAEHLVRWRDVAGARPPIRRR